jgi:hypothetical protein
MEQQIGKDGEIFYSNGISMLSVFPLMEFLGKDIGKIVTQ